MASDEIAIHEKKNNKLNKKQTKKKSIKQTNKQKTNKQTTSHGITLYPPLSSGADGIYCQHVKIKCLFPNDHKLVIYLS